MNNKGFMLIEAIIVMAIIGILAVVIVHILEERKQREQYEAQHDVSIEKHVIYTDEYKISGVVNKLYHVEINGVRCIVLDGGNGDAISCDWNQEEKQ